MKQPILLTLPLPNQPLLDLREQAHDAAAAAIRSGMQVEDVALTLSLLATDIRYAAKLHRDALGRDIWP